MKVLTAIFYLLRRLWFTVFPRKVGKKGWAPTTTPTLSAGAVLPTAPASWTSPRLRWGYLGNDVYGDCVFAAIAHAIEAVGHFVKDTVNFTTAQVVKAYLAWDQGQDNGVYVDQLLNTWQTDERSNTALPPFGIGGPFIKLDPTNVAQLKSAIATFGWVMVGSNLQQAQEDQFSKGQKWDYVPGSIIVGGHAVCLVGYDKGNVGPYVVSWAKGFRATWAWVTNTCPEAYTGVLPPHLKAGKYVATLTELDAYCAALPAA